MSEMNSKTLTVLAAGAHPDDIEFMMAGTLLLLKDCGAEIHMWNMANGNCGSDSLDKIETAETRWREAKASAALEGAFMHPPVTHDFGLVYTENMASKCAAYVRKIRPDILLVPSLEDYMEDHQNAARLLVTAAFTRAMWNFATMPDTVPYSADVAIYHAMPYGLRDAMRQRIVPEFFTDISGVIDRKRAMLACHESQRRFLESTQGVDAYTEMMLSMSKEVGDMSGRFEYAEGWRRHSHLGFAAENYDPLGNILNKYCFINDKYDQ